MRHTGKCIVILMWILSFYAANAQDVIKWQFKTGADIVSTPLILDNVLYIGSADSNVYALNATTGEEIWNYKSKNPIYSSPAIYDSIICFESGNILYALDILGNYLWEKQLYEGDVTELIDSWNYFHSSPYLVDSIVYIGTEGGHVHGINLKDSTTVFHVQSPGQNIIRVTPKVFGDLIYFGDWDGVMYAYNLETEDLVWDYDTKEDEDYTGWENSVQTAIEIFDSAVYFSGRNCRLYCLDAVSGTTRWMWEEPSDMWVVGGPVIRDSVLYVGSSNQYVLYCFNAITGVQNYTTPLDDRMWSTAWIDDNFVYAGSGSLFRVEKESGDVVGRFDVEGVVHSSPVIVDSILYFGTTGGDIFALNQKAFIEHEYAITSFTPGSVNLGELTNDAGNQYITFYLRNYGEGEDSVSVDFASSASEVLDALNMTELNTSIPATDSLEIALVLDPTNIPSGGHYIRLTATSFNNLLSESLNKSVSFTIEEEVGIFDNRVQETDIHSIRPNPFSNMATIKYFLGEAGSVEIKIIDVQGRIIQYILSENQYSGNHSIVFDGHRLSAGDYYCVLSTKDKEIIRKLVLVK